MNNGDQPAYPISFDIVQLCGEKPNPFGMSKREKIATSIYGNLINRVIRKDCENDEEFYKRVSKVSLIAANELLKQLENGN